VVETLCDLHFFDVFLEIEDNLQRLLFRMRGVVVVDLHCKSEAIIGNLSALALDALFDMGARSDVDICPFEQGKGLTALSWGGNEGTIFATVLVGSNLLAEDICHVAREARINIGWSRLP